MLEFIRERSKGIIVWVIVGLIILTFALFGLNSYLAGGTNRNVATVNGVDITQNEYQRALQNYQHYLQRMMGKNYDPAMFDEKTMQHEVVNSLISQELTRQFLKDSKMGVAPQILVNEIEGIQAFHDNRGKFSREYYQLTLKQQGMTEAAFENDLSHDVASRYLRNGIIQTDFVTQQEFAQQQALLLQQREAGYIAFPSSAYLNSVTPTTQEIENYYKLNSSRFSTPELVSIDYVDMNLADLASKRSVSEQAIREHYDANQKQYMISEAQRRARHILIKIDKDTDDSAALSKIKVLRARILKGESFADVAKKESQDPGSAKQGGDLGFFAKGVMDPAFEAVAFALKKGELSEPVKSRFGYHLIKLEDLQPEQVKPFKDVHDGIKKELQMQQVEQEYYANIERLDNLAYNNSGSLQSISDELGLKIQQSPLFERHSGSGLFANPKIISAAFGSDVLRDGRNSSLIDISDTESVVLRLHEHKPSVVRPLKEVESRIVVELKQQQAARAATADADKLMQMLTQGTSIDVALKKFPIAKLVRVGLIGRTPGGKEHETARKLDPSIRGKIFSLAPPQQDRPSFGQLSLANGDSVLALAYSVNPGESPKDTSQLATARKQLSEGNGTSSYAALQDALREEAKIKVTLTTTE